MKLPHEWNAQAYLRSGSNNDGHKRSRCFCLLTWHEEPAVGRLGKPSYCPSNNATRLIPSKKHTNTVIYQLPSCFLYVFIGAHKKEILAFLSSPQHRSAHGHVRMLSEKCWRAEMPYTVDGIIGKQMETIATSKTVTSCQLDGVPLCAHPSSLMGGVPFTSGSPLVQPRRQHATCVQHLQPVTNDELL